MIAGLLRVILKVVLVVAATAAVLMLAGEFLRQLVPEAYHQPLWLTGLLISISSFLGALVVTGFAPRKRKLENLLLVGAAFGGLLYLLFVTGSDCTLVQSARGRLRLQCGDVGGTVMDQPITR